MGGIFRSILLICCLAFAVPAFGAKNLAEALTMAEKGVSLEPGNALYALSLAQVLARMGRFGDAEIAARTARANATNSTERANADQFLAYLQRAKN